MSGVEDMSDAGRDVDSRLSRLEGTVESLAKSVGGLADDVKIMARSLSTSGRANWGWIFAGAGLVVSVVFAMNRATVAPLERDLSHLRERRDEDHVLQFDMLKRLAEHSKHIALLQAEAAENAHELDLIWQRRFNELEQDGRQEEWRRIVELHLLGDTP